MSPMPTPSTRTIQPGAGDRMRSWLTSRSAFVRLVMWVVAIVATLGASLWWYGSTEPDTFSREAAIALLGAVVTLLSAAVVATLALVQQLRRAREVETLTRFAEDSRRLRSLRVGRMEIPGIVVVASGNNHLEWTDRADVEFGDWAAERPLDEEVRQVIDARIPGFVEEARRRKSPFSDDPAVDLVDARVELRPDASGKRRPVYRLTPAPMTYFPFFATAARLDDAALDDPRPLRERFGPDVRSIEDVARLRLNAKVGVGTLVVTSDDRLVLGVRGRTMIAGGDERTDGRSAVHVVAEGAMPHDVDRKGRFDPLATARRGLMEEVGLGGDVRAIGWVRQLVQTGFFLDQQRWQPCFANLAHIDLSWDEFATAATTAQDRWEVERYVSLPFHIEHPGLRLLLLGQHPDLALASNHAAAVLWFGLLYRHGFTTMRDMLARPVDEKLLVS